MLLKRKQENSPRKLTIAHKKTDKNVSLFRNKRTPLKISIVVPNEHVYGVPKSFIDSMSLNEMLKASTIAEAILRGEKIPATRQSSKVQKYVNNILKLSCKNSTRDIAKKMQQNLNVRIVKKNRCTVNPKKAQQLYQEFMKMN